MLTLPAPSLQPFKYALDCSEARKSRFAIRFFSFVVVVAVVVVVVVVVLFFFFLYYY